MEKAKNSSFSSSELQWEKRHSCFSHGCFSGRRYFLNQKRAEVFAKRVGGKVRSFYLMIHEDDPGDCWIVTWKV